MVYVSLPGEKNFNFQDLQNDAHKDHRIKIQKTQI